MRRGRLHQGIRYALLRRNSVLHISQEGAHRTNSCRTHQRSAPRRGRHFGRCHGRVEWLADREPRCLYLQWKRGILRAHFRTRATHRTMRQDQLDRRIHRYAVSRRVPSQLSSRAKYARLHHAAKDHTHTKPKSTVAYGTRDRTQADSPNIDAQMVRRSVPSANASAGGGTGQSPSRPTRRRRRAPRPSPAARR